MCFRGIGLILYSIAAIMKKLLLGILFLVPFVLKAQTITTFAGCGTSCTGLGDGGPATAAVIQDPVGSKFDKSGNLYFASCISGNRIRKIDLTGVITTIAGNTTGSFGGDNGPATAALLNAPVDVAFDTSNNLYISDPQNFRVRKINSITGIITTVAGNGIGTYGGDDIAATATSIWGNNQICLDKLGNLYIADYYNQRIRKVSPTGIMTTVAGTGTASSLGDGTPATSAPINYPSGVAIDTSGNLYIGEANGYRVRKVDLSGIITTFAGNGNPAYAGDGIPATNAQIEPTHLAIDDFGNLFIGDSYNNRVFKVDAMGMLYNVAGNGLTGYSGDGVAATATSLDYPSGISLDACGNLYISEADNRRIRKVTFNPTCTVTTLNTNITTQTGKSVNVYPNPTNDLIQIDNIAVPTNYQVHTIVGVTVLRGILKQGSNSISLKALPAGMYLLELVGDDGGRVVRRVVKSEL